MIGASSNSDVKITQDLFLSYEKASQSKLNTGKSQVMSLNASNIKPPKGMQTPKEPIRHLGILINNSGTADFFTEDNLLSGISTSIKKWKAQNLSAISQTK